MKKSDLFYFLLPLCLLVCAGCGSKTEQTSVEMTETTVISTETTVSETVSTTTKKSTARTAQTTVTSTTKKETVSTTISEMTPDPEQTSIVSSEILQDNKNPLETVLVYYYVKKDDKNKKTVYTATAKVTTPVTTHTTTKTVVTTPPPAETAPPETQPETEQETQPAVVHFTGSVPEIISQMTLEQKIYQMFVITPESLTGVNVATAAGESTHQAIISQPVGGIIYFGDNLVSSGQTSQMLSNTQQYARESGIGMFLAVDEEGGLVARCAKKLGTTKLNPMGTYGTDNNWDTAFWIGQTLGNDIHQFGFNVDFAPVADVNLNSGNELGNRIFSSDPNVVGNMVSGVVQGLQSTGVASALKHFPGLGAENGNAHYDEKIIIDRSLDDLRNVEFVPFRSGISAGVDFVMVSHQIITGAGDNLPSCLSPVICTDLLRNELGFNGIIITDSFAMNTISGSYSPADSAVMAVNAGVDIILIPTDLYSSVHAIEDAVNSGRISEERINQSVERILNEKEKLGLLG